MPPDAGSLDDLRIDYGAHERRLGRRWLWLLLAVLLAMTATGAAIWGWRARAAAPLVEVATVQAAAAGAQAAVLNASGYVTARRRATVSSKITGKVVDVRVEEGMAVEQGQILARLDDSAPRAYLELSEAQLAEARQAVAETEVRLREARLTLDRMRQLVEEGVAGRAELDAAEAEVDSLVARIDLNRQQVAVAARQVGVRRTELEDTVIRAPFSGIAISKDAQPGEMVSPVSAGGGFTRTGISTIVDMGSLEIEVDVSESYINRVAPGQAVEATLDAYPDWPIPAHVITTVPAADRQKATMLVRIGFDTLDPRILPDMGVKVAFLEDDGPDEAAEAPALTIPATAVRRHDDRDVVFVVRDRTLERRAVRLGSRAAESVVVLAGLSAGERVVSAGPADLADGDVVRLE